MNGQPTAYRAECYCGWSTTHFSDSVCAARLRAHTKREHQTSTSIPQEPEHLWT